MSETIYNKIPVDGLKMKTIQKEKLKSLSS